MIVDLESDYIMSQHLDAAASSDEEEAIGELLSRPADQGDGQPDRDLARRTKSCW